MSILADKVKLMTAMLQAVMVAPTILSADDFDRDALALEPVKSRGKVMPLSNSK